MVLQPVVSSQQPGEKLLVEGSQPSSQRMLQPTVIKASSTADPWRFRHAPVVFSEVGADVRLLILLPLQRTSFVHASYGETPS